jgi:hypothetical protein
LVVVPVRSWREVHEPVHFGTIGKEPDDIASIIDPVDESPITPNAGICDEPVASN